MLKTVQDLYLSMRVLILLDLKYIGRFWTSFEAWCAMQKTTPNGLIPAQDAGRYHITCLFNATDGLKTELVQMLARKTPEEMHRYLAQDDIEVTNAKDKETILPTVAETNTYVRNLFATAAAAAKEKEEQRKKHALAEEKREQARKLMQDVREAKEQAHKLWREAEQLEV